MKAMKRIAAMGLALALVLLLSAPAAALDWEDISITKHPQGGEIPYGKNITLSVEAEFPADCVARYAWYSQGGGVVVAEGQTVEIGPDNPSYPKAVQPYYSAGTYFYCSVTIFETDVAGEPLDTGETLFSDTAYITVLPQRNQNLWEKIADAFRSASVNLFLLTYLGFMIVFGILLAPFQLVSTLLT